LDTKAPDAFRTISEVADDLDLPQHVLRFWETRFQQIKPMKRGGFSAGEAHLLVNRLAQVRPRYCFTGHRLPH
jgi:hypothetical protein